MKEQNMKFGEYIKKKRLADPRELTLSDVAKHMGISLSLLSDIEQDRRNPSEKFELEKFADFLDLSEEDRALMFDLAGRKCREVPADIEDTLMYSNIGDMARFALRQSNAGKISEEDWKKFIREMDEKNGGS